MKLRVSIIFSAAFAAALVWAGTAAVQWAGYGHDDQHTALSSVGGQPLMNIHWSVPVDLHPGGAVTPDGAVKPDGGGDDELLIHYGSPMVTAANTVLVPVKTGVTDGFEVVAYNGATGAALYTLSTDYTLPPHGWTPPYGAVLTSANRLYYPGAGGTVYYRDSVDSTTGTTGQIAFYSNSLYNNHKALFNKVVQISTPLTADSAGNVYFGFIAHGVNPGNLTGGIARIGANGVGTFVTAASTAGGDTAIKEVQINCAPALSNDEQTLYIAVTSGSSMADGYLVSLQASTLAPIARVQLMDPRGGAATLSTDSSASPTVGPDGDVYYGVLEDPCCSSHNDRGWLLHFNAALTETKIPGSFGWDDTASIVPASLVPSYTGTSSYLVLTKYNNYVDTGTGNGVNQVAVLDPEASQLDEYSTTPVTVMKEVITVTGVTPDPHAGFPNAVKEWCINTAVIDPVNKSAIINSEDGTVYRWDFTTNTLSQKVKLTAGIGEAYTPTAIGADGTIYAINDAILFAVGN